jgi:hypothetical protein
MTVSHAWYNDIIFNAEEMQDNQGNLFLTTDQANPDLIGETADDKQSLISPQI